MGEVYIYIPVCIYMHISAYDRMCVHVFAIFAAASAVDQEFMANAAKE